MTDDCKTMLSSATNLNNVEKSSEEKLPVGKLCAQINNIKLELNPAEEQDSNCPPSHILLTLDKNSQCSGKSVKHAQTDAALKPLKETTISNLSKTNKKKIMNPSSLTPTVKLNGLAMARGEIVKYEVVSRIPLPCQPIYRKSKQELKNPPYNIYGVPFQYGEMGYNLCGDMGYNNNYRINLEKTVQRWIYPHLFRIQVTVGEHKFSGEGKTQQAARHDAAQKALDLLEAMPIPTKVKTSNKQHVLTKDKNKNGLSGNAESTTTDSTPNHKSSISLLYERAAVHKLHVEFILTQEVGPPHLKNFQMKVIVKSNKSRQESNTAADVLIVAEAIGANKKLAKAKAASAALEKLDSGLLPDLKSVHAKSNKTPEKESASMHPVSRLAQIVQAKKESDPVYTVISETKGALRGMKFVIKCEALGKNGEGEGSNKRDAKRLAAENLLINAGLLPKSIATKTKTNSQGKTSSLSQHSKLNSMRHNVMPTLVESGQEFN